MWQLLFGTYLIKRCVLFLFPVVCIMKITRELSFLEYGQEVMTMALSNLYGWSKEAENLTAASCGTACGAADKPEEKPAAACGSACGAADKPEEKPAAACGSACGAGDGQ